MALGASLVIGAPPSSAATVVRTIVVGDTEYDDNPVLGIASNGTDVWVANDGANTVTELDAATGTAVQTVGVGRGPDGVSINGTHVWVSNWEGSTVTELNAVTGAVPQTIGVGSGPNGISSDGTHVWVVNSDDYTVTELDAATGAVVEYIPQARVSGLASRRTAPTSGYQTTSTR